MDIVEKIIIPILAAFLGAFLAFLYQSRNDLRKSKKDILAVLMAYRGKYQEVPDFRHAINMIDVIFYGNKVVRAKRVEYLRNLERDRIGTQEYINNLIDLILLIAADSGYNNLTRENVLSYFHPVTHNTPPESKNAEDEV